MMIPNNTEYMFAVVVLITLTLWCVSVHHASQHQCDFPLWLALRQNTAQDVGPVALKSMHNQQRCRRADLSLGCGRWCNEPRQTPEKVILLETNSLFRRWLVFHSDDEDY